MIECKNCHTILIGDKKGTLMWCKCGKVAIDDTPHYTRIIGEPADYKILNGGDEIDRGRKISKEDNKVVGR